MLTATPIDVALLHQSAVWKTWGDGQILRTVLLDHMAVEHRTRVLAQLRDRAHELLLAECDRVATAQRRGQLTDEAFAVALAQLADADPHVWLEDTALVRRLVQLVPRPAPRPRRGLLRRWKR